MEILSETITIGDYSFMYSSALVMTCVGPSYEFSCTWPSRDGIPVLTLKCLRKPDIAHNRAQFEDEETGSYFTRDGKDISRFNIETNCHAYGLSIDFNTGECSFYLNGGYHEDPWDRLDRQVFKSLFTVQN
ncbi:MAG: hypothetical protein ACYCQJ_14310 [Nitrososphaerales archaeon]